MSMGFAQPGSAPPPPSLVVGRWEDLVRLKELLTKNVRAKDSGVLSLRGSLIKDARGRMSSGFGRPLTQEALAELTGLNLRTIKNAEAGHPIRIETGLVIARSLKTPLDTLIAPAGESVAVQVLIVMRGLPGVGKTTIGAALAHDEEMKCSFPDGILWASLGQSPDSLGELAAWGRALGVADIDREREKKYARARLTALLRDKRLLLIIDDAWTPDPAVDLMVGGPRCATLVTTRITEVADAIAPSEEDIYHLDVLSEDDSVKLLEALASSVVANHRDKARELTKELERLPLALQVAGRLLRAEERKGLGVIDLLEELRHAAKLLDKDAPGGPKVAALLKKSTDVLDESARNCFKYLAPFPNKPATFNQKALQDMWKGMADDPKQMADFLISRGLLEPVDGGRFWLHALLVAHAESLLRGSAGL